jgi:Protein kinase domain
MTATGIVFGTPGYMSPEQAEGKPAGPASDVFALGGVVAYAATGREPFGPGTAASVLYRVVYAEPDLDGVPPRLRELIGTCLAKDPAARLALPTLATAIAGGTHDTGPSALSFWPRSVASLIGAYQASLDTQLSAGAGAVGTDSSTGLVSAGTEHPPTALAPPAAGVATSPAATQAAAPGQMTYPATQGYGGAQGNAGLQSAGYPPGGAGYSQPIPAAWHPPAQRPALPASIRRAVRFMYAAAIIALLNGFRALADISTYGGHVPQRVFGQVHVVTRSTAFTEVTIGFVIQVALWMGLAQACKNGKNWARITGIVFFGILTIGLLTSIRSSPAGPGLILGVIGWLAGLGAVVLLWRRSSSAFFRTAKGSR